MFLNPKVVITLAAVTASPVKCDGTTTCSFVFRPNVPVDSSSTNLNAEFDFTFEHTLPTPVHSNQIFGASSSIWVDNGDGTYNVQDTIGAVGESSASTASIIEGWLGTQLFGRSIIWLVKEVTCF